MGRAVAYGASMYYPGATFEGLIAFYAHVVGLPIKHFVQQMTYGQWLYFLYLRLVFGILCWIPGFLRCISTLAQFSIGLVVSRSDTAGWWPKQWAPQQVGGMDAFWSLTRAPASESTAQWAEIRSIKVSLTSVPLKKTEIIHLKKYSRLAGFTMSSLSSSSIYLKGILLIVDKAWFLMWKLNLICISSVDQRSYSSTNFYFY